MLQPRRLCFKHNKTRVRARRLCVSYFQLNGVMPIRSHAEAQRTRRNDAGWQGLEFTREALRQTRTKNEDVRVGSQETLRASVVGSFVLRG